MNIIFVILFLLYACFKLAFGRAIELKSEANKKEYDRICSIVYNKNLERDLIEKINRSKSLREEMFNEVREDMEYIFSGDQMCYLQNPVICPAYLELNPFYNDTSIASMVLSVWLSKKGYIRFKKSFYPLGPYQEVSGFFEVDKNKREAVFNRFALTIEKYIKAAHPNEPTVRLIPNYDDEYGLSSYSWEFSLPRNSA